MNRGALGRWGDGEMGRWGDGEMGRWGDGEMVDRLVHKWIDRWSRYGNGNLS
ncbi:MAG: hypothetical protein F6K49_32735 [Moorea sp. SIO3I6]|nr:hypothetical protein [Moorena sp. SIO3I6]